MKGGRVGRRSSFGAHLVPAVDTSRDRSERHEPDEMPALGLVKVRNGRVGGGPLRGKRGRVRSGSVHAGRLPAEEKRRT